MENTKKLTKWLLNNDKALKLKVTKVRWVDEWLPGFFDFSIKIELNGIKFIGRGVDENQGVAFVKAGSEAIERAVCNSNSIPTFGVAAHTELHKAKENAKLEVIERDRFFCHFLTKTPFRNITGLKLEGIDLERIENKLLERDIRLRFLEMNSICGVSSTMCLASSDNKSFGIIGLGASSDIYKALEHALIECLTNTANQVYQTQDGNNFLKENPWALDKNGFYKEESNPQFSFKELSLGYSELKDCPIHLYKCESEDVQHAFFGEVKKEKVNLERLNVFKGYKISFDKINKAPNPLEVKI